MTLKEIINNLMLYNTFRKLREEYNKPYKHADERKEYILRNNFNLLHISYTNPVNAA